MKSGTVSPQIRWTPSQNKLEEMYNLEDALVVAMHLNAFIRHARTVRMANIAQIVNVIALFLLDLIVWSYNHLLSFRTLLTTCGKDSLDIWWTGTHLRGKIFGSSNSRRVATWIKLPTIVIYVINRSPDKSMKPRLL